MPPQASAGHDRFPSIKVTRAMAVIMDGFDFVPVVRVCHPDPHRISFVGMRHVSSIGTYLWLMAHLPLWLKILWHSSDPDQLGIMPYIGPGLGFRLTIW